MRRSRLPSGWTPLELVKHLRYVELRWLEWGFEGRDVGDPWADSEGGRWRVGPDETLASLLPACASRPRGAGPSSRPTTWTRWESPVADAATLERVLFHLLQEYARHAGHLDIVTELATGSSGE